MDCEAAECETLSIPFRWLLFPFRFQRQTRGVLSRNKKSLADFVEVLLTIPRFALFIFQKRRRILKDISNFHCLLVNVSYE